MHRRLYACFYGNACAHLLQTHTFLYRQRIVQLKDGEESEVNRVTFTVGLNARLRVLMVQNVQGGGGVGGCPAYSVSVAGGALLWWSVCEPGEEWYRTWHGGCVACQCGSSLWHVYNNSHFHASVHSLLVSHRLHSGHPFKHHAFSFSGFLGTTRKMINNSAKYTKNCFFFRQLDAEMLPVIQGRF